MAVFDKHNTNTAKGRGCTAEQPTFVIMAKKGLQVKRKVRKLEGTIKKLFDNYGFIEVEDREKDLFFHHSEANGFSELKEGDQVEFEIGQGRKGDEVAVQVEKVEIEEEK